MMRSGRFIIVSFIILLFLTFRVIGVQPYGSFVYTREHLITLKSVSICDPTSYRILNIPEEIRRKTVRGCRGGRKQHGGKVKRSVAWKENMRKYKPYLPSLIMGNVRLLENKMDELKALVRMENFFRECSLLCFTETWLHDGIPDSSINIDVSLQSVEIGEEKSAVRGKEEDWLFLLTTCGVTRVM